MKKKPSISTSKSQVRIIGGVHKRRLLDFVDTDGLRPTPDRLRETLFNWLTGHLVDAKVLDVCAGSGALGFEALSRGAQSAVLIEKHSQQSTLLHHNAKTLNLNAQILKGDCLQILPTLQGSFDVVFIDPPYALNLWQAILDLLIQNKLIHQDTLLYIESHQTLDAITTSTLTPIKHAKVGQIFAYLCQFDGLT